MSDYRRDIARGAREVRWGAMKIFMIFVPVILFFVCITFGTRWIGIEWDGFFKAKKQAIERKIYEETPSYVHAKKQDIVRFRLEYIREDDETAKKAILGTVRMQFAEFNPKHLTDPAVRAFYDRAMRGE